MSEDIRGSIAGRMLGLGFTRPEIEFFLGDFNDIVENGGPDLKAVEPIEFEGEAPRGPVISIKLDPADSDYVLITSDTQFKTEGGGDIRDGTIQLRVGEIRRKLQKNNREGYVSIGEDRYSYE
jgi:hypothetical protein